MLREFEQIIGTEMYEAFILMLKEIGPEARTHRISVVIAAMLRYAFDQLPPDYEECTLGEALIAFDEEPHLMYEIPRVKEALYPLINSLCREADLRNERENYQGVPYSIAENTVYEYVSWYNMPWED